MGSTDYEDASYCRCCFAQGASQSVQVRARGQDLRRTLDELIFTLQHHPSRVQWCANPLAARYPGSGKLHPEGLLGALSVSAC